MKRVVKWLLIAWVALMSLSAAEPMELSQVGKPEMIAVDQDLLYVLEGTTIHMYRLDKGEYLGNFGKDGEGPGEIKKNPFGGPILVVPFQGKLFVTSMGKLTVFSRSGEFIREYKVNASDSFYPFADRFVCMGTHEVSEGKMVMAVFMSDAELNRGKLLYASDFEVGQNFRFEFPMTPFYPTMTDDQLFIIAGKEGFVIDAFDQQGNKQYRIEKEEPLISLPATYQAETEKAFKRNPNFAAAWEFMKNRISYKKHFPQVYGYFPDGNRLFVLTYKMRGDERECIVMDLKGKEIRRIWLPIPEVYGFDFGAQFTAADSVFYYLKENEETENWELHTRSLGQK